jgi:hypothetical protein
MRRTPEDRSIVPFPTHAVSNMEWVPTGITEKGTIGNLATTPSAELSCGPAVANLRSAPAARRAAQLVVAAQ